MFKVLRAICVIMLLSSLTSCFKETATLKYIKGDALGTYYTIQYRGNLTEIDVELMVAETLEQMNHELSNWDQESWVSQFNRSKSTDWFDVPPHALAVIQFSLELAHKTNGHFDPTLGQLIKLWGFGEDGEVVSPPNPEQINKMLEQSGYEKIVLDFENKRIRKISPDLEINVSACAKGYIVDQIHIKLESLGVQHSLINIGGEVRSQGTKANAKPWRISTVNNKHIFTLEDQAAATSGTTQRFFTYQGETYSHLVSALSGYPIRAKYQSITVVSKNCMLADGLATAFLITPEHSWRELMLYFQVSIQHTEHSKL